jgi:uncharacterized glyoxalase superfamily protein PhnB
VGEWRTSIPTKGASLLPSAVGIAFIIVLHHDERREEMAITPYLYYENLTKTMAWLAKAFGLKQYGHVMKGPDGEASHAAMKLGKGIVMMGRPDPKQRYKNPKRLGGTTQSLYVMVGNVDRHFQRAKNVGAKIIEEPADTEYGHRRYGARDPEGHECYFAQDKKARKRGAAKDRRPE